ncbi:hypothetical protein HAX54_005230 [Datura stramonium]|uniref:Uncharacterized protein n=1 Tax=Datura stramonium TaxID=4076 RepID=A0ABS8T9Z7_DATST|nr:hypothetical protein [Datura stramonium]
MMLVFRGRDLSQSFKELTHIMILFSEYRSVGNRKDWNAVTNKTMANKNNNKKNNDAQVTHIMCQNQYATLENEKSRDENKAGGSNQMIGTTKKDKSKSEATLGDHVEKVIKDKEDVYKAFVNDNNKDKNEA